MDVAPLHRYGHYEGRVARTLDFWRQSFAIWRQLATPYPGEAPSGRDPIETRLFPDPGPRLVLR
jgi:hypothetical protein